MFYLQSLLLIIYYITPCLFSNFPSKYSNLPLFLYKSVPQFPSSLLLLYPTIFSDVMFPFTDSHIVCSHFFLHLSLSLNTLIKLEWRSPALGIMDTPPTPIEMMLSDNALLTSNRITVAGCQESGRSSL